MRPLRIVLSRRGGFELQAMSLALNGLPAQSVARPGPWGNPFTIGAVMDETGLDKDAAQVEAVSRYGRWVAGEIDGPKSPPSRDKFVLTWRARTSPAGAGRARPAMSIPCSSWPMNRALRPHSPVARTTIQEWSA